MIQPAAAQPAVAKPAATSGNSLGLKLKVGVPPPAETGGDDSSSGEEESLGTGGG